METASKNKGTFKVFRILFLVFAVFSYILGILLALVSFLSLSTRIESFKTVLESVFPALIRFSVGQLQAVAVSSAISTLLSGLLFHLSSSLLFKMEKDGTAFTVESSKKTRNLGIETLSLSAFSAFCSFTLYQASDIVFLQPSSFFIGIVMGLVLILASFILKEGALLTEEKSDLQTEKEPSLKEGGQKESKRSKKKKKRMEQQKKEKEELPPQEEPEKSDNDIKKA